MCIARTRAATERICLSLEHPQVSADGVAALFLKHGVTNVVRASSPLPRADTSCTLIGMVLLRGCRVLLRLQLVRRHTGDAVLGVVDARASPTPVDGSSQPTLVAVVTAVTTGVSNAVRCDVAGLSGRTSTRMVDVLTRVLASLPQGALVVQRCGQLRLHAVAQRALQSLPWAMDPSCHDGAALLLHSVLAAC
jgi:hypothetical protein